MSLGGRVFSHAALSREEKNGRLSRTWIQTDLNIQTSRSIAHPVQEHTQGQGFVPRIFLAQFTTRFIDLSQVPNISNKVGAEL